MNRQKSNQFCNNCINQGHLFNQCRTPITSVGIVSFIKEKDTTVLDRSTTAQLVQFSTDPRSCKGA